MVPDERKRAGLPFEWNSLEHYEPGRTRLIHYTDMPTQPWVSSANKNGALFYATCKEAIAEGFIDPNFVYDEVARGHVSPDLPEWIGMPAPAHVHRLRKEWKAPYQRFVGLPKSAPKAGA